MLKKTSQDSILMENLNLDIDSYSLTDLINLFSLDKSFTRKAVDNGKSKLHNQLQKVSYLGAEKKREIGLFIDSAASKLANLKGKTDENEGTWSQEFNTMVSSGSHYLIENPNVAEGKTAKYSDGRIAGSESFPPGFINPINVKTTIVGMNVDSRFRDDYYSTRSSNFTLHLPQRQKKVVSMRIATTEMPATWYAVSRKRGDANFVIIDRADTVGDLSGALLDYSNLSNVESRSYGSLGSSKPAWLVTLPDGNYEHNFQGESNAADTATAINNSISLAIPGYVTDNDGKFYGKDSPSVGDYLNPGLDINFQVSRASGRSVFARPKNTDGTIPTPNHLGSGFIIDFAVDPNGYSNLNENIQLRLGWQLGFRLGRYEAASILSEGICLISGPRYMFIAIDDGQKNAGSSFIAAYSQSSLDKNIMTRINASTVLDDVGVFKTASDPGLSNQLNRTREYFGPVNIDRLHISLLDEFGRELELNSMDWSMTLVFESLYD